MAGRGFVLSMLLLASLAQAESLWKEYRSTLSEVRPGEVRVVTSQRLDGVTRRYSQVVSGRLHEVSCQARGTGRVQLGVNGSTGWAYSRETELDPQAWKTLTVSYFETAPAFTISLYTLESNGAVFEAKDATVVVQDAIALPDADVTVAFEAEDYPGSNGQLGEVEGAIGGKAVRGGRHYQLALMPTPVTSRPLYAYCRVRRDAEAAVQVAVGRGQQQVLGRADVAPGADWQWVKVGPISAAAMFPQAACRVAGDAQAGLWLDRVVFSTSPDLAAPDAVAAAPVYAQGLVAAGRAKTPPTIDGRGDDACWQETLALGPFVLNKESRPAQEQTTVRLAWDDAYRSTLRHNPSHAPALATEGCDALCFVSHIVATDMIPGVYREEQLQEFCDTAERRFNAERDAITRDNPPSLTPDSDGEVSALVDMAMRISRDLACSESRAGRR